MGVKGDGGRDAEQSESNAANDRAESYRPAERYSVLFRDTFSVIAVQSGDVAGHIYCTDHANHRTEYKCHYKVFHNYILCIINLS